MNKQKWFNELCEVLLILENSHPKMKMQIKSRYGLTDCPILQFFPISIVVFDYEIEKYPEAYKRYQKNSGEWQNKLTVKQKEYRSKIIRKWVAERNNSKEESHDKDKV